MSVLAKILNKSITRVVGQTSKFDLAVDDMLEKFKESCPPKAELLKIVKQKNQIQTALSNVVNVLNSVESTAETAETIVTTVSSAVTVIKAIPIPTSVPPGIGVPINVITILADSLDLLGDTLKGMKGVVSGVPDALQIIIKAAQDIINKLQLLDGVLNKCIEELSEGMTQEEKNELISEIGSVAATAGTFSDDVLNLADESALEARLDPNSNDPLFYKGFKLEIQYNAQNEFSFPQRRIYGYQDASIDTETALKDRFGSGYVKKTYPSREIYNLPDKGYSYSTSVKVLIDEIKFRIDALRPLSPTVEKVYTTQFPPPSQDAGNQPRGGALGPAGTPPPPPPPPKAIISGNNSITLPTNANNLLQSGTITINEAPISVRIAADTGINTLTNSRDLGSITATFKPKVTGNSTTITVSKGFKTVEYTYTENGTYNWTLQVTQAQALNDNTGAIVGFAIV